MMKRIALSLALASTTFVLAGCGGSSPPAGEAVPVEGADGVLIQEEWPDEVKEAEMQFQKAAAEKGQRQGN